MVAYGATAEKRKIFYPEISIRFGLLHKINMTNKKPFKFFYDVLHFSQRRPWVTLISFLLLFGISLWGLQFSCFELDIYDVYDPSFPGSMDLKDMKSNYDDHTQILIYFNFKKPPVAGEICKLLNWSKQVAKSGDIKNATSLWSLRAPSLEENKLWYKNLLDDPCQMDPNRLIQLNKDYLTSYFRHLLAKTGSQDLVFDISFADKKLEVKKIQKLIANTDKFIARELKDVKVHYLGLAGFRYFFKKIMTEDQFVSVFVLLIILLFLRLFYGTWKSGFLLGLTLVFINVILYGIIALSGNSIDILTNNLFLMTAVAATADFIFVTQYQMKGNYQDSLEGLIVPSFFTTLTTMVGFLSLNTSDLELIKRFGNGAALGALLEWMMLFQLLPAVLKILKKEVVWVNPEKAIDGKWIKKLEDFTLPPKALKVFLLLMVLSVPSFFFLNDQDSPVKNLPKDHILRIGSEKFLKKFDWQGQVYLYFPDVPEKEEYRHIVTELANFENVFKVEDPEEIAEDWVKDFPLLKQDLIKCELSMTPLWEKYYSRAGTLRVPLYLKEQDLKYLRRLRDFVAWICKGSCRLAGQRVVYLEYGEKISVTMIESFAVSIFLVVGILGYLLWSVGKIEHFWAVVISSLMGPLAILSLMAIFQIQVTVITSIFLAIMVGLAGDNAIQYLMTPDEDLEVGIESRARASIMVTLVMVMASSLFLAQTIKSMKILGLLFILGLTINLIGDLFGLKGLLTKKRRP